MCVDCSCLQSLRRQWRGKTSSYVETGCTINSLLKDLMPSTTLGSSHLRLVTTIIYLTTITTTTTMGRVRSDLEKNQVF